MTKLKKGTKKYDGILWSSKRNQGVSVNNVYGKCSVYKQRAEKDIKAFMEEIGGYNYHICGHNSNFFTCTFETDNEIYFYTHANSYVLEK